MSQPLLTIIIPTFERPDSLRLCVDSLSRCEYPRSRMEVIVVNDGGLAEPEQFLPRGELSLSFLRQENRGPAAARNLGASHAKGDLLVFIDDDCQASAGWLAQLAEAHIKAPREMLGGLVVNALPDNPYAAASQFLLDRVYEQCNGGPSQGSFLTSNNMAVPVRGFHEVGGFDERLRTAEDRDLCDRWRFAGKRISLLPEAIVYHAHEMGLAGFCRQHYSYGRGASMFHRLRSARGSGTMRESIAFHRDPRNWMIPALERGRPHGWTIAALTVVLQFANAAGYCRQELAGRLPALDKHSPVPTQARPESDRSTAGRRTA